MGVQRRRASRRVGTIRSGSTMRARWARPRMSPGPSPLTASMTCAASRATTNCLAQEAAARGRGVLLVDLNPRGTAAEGVPGLTEGAAGVRYGEDLAPSLLPVWGVTRGV